MKNVNYYIARLSYNEMQFLRRLLQAELMIQTIITLRHPDVTSSFKDIKGMNGISKENLEVAAKAALACETFHKYRDVDDYFEEIQLVLGSYPDKTKLFDVIMGNTGMATINSLLSVTAREKDIPAELQALSEAYTDILKERMDKAQTQKYTYDEIKAKSAEFVKQTHEAAQPAPAEKTKDFDNSNLFKVNILGKKGLA